MKNEESKAWAISSLVTGIVGLCLFLMPYFGIVLSIFAIVASRKNKIDGMSTAGLVLGILGTIINCIVGLFTLIVLLIGWLV